jgi:hypothetical protein
MPSGANANCTTPIASVANSSPRSERALAWDREPALGDGDMKPAMSSFALRAAGAYRYCKRP